MVYSLIENPSQKALDQHAILLANGGVRPYSRKVLGLYETLTPEMDLINSMLEITDIDSLNDTVVVSNIRPLRPYFVNSEPSQPTVYVEYENGYYVKNIKLINAGVDFNNDIIMEEIPLTIKEYYNQYNLLN